MKSIGFLQRDLCKQFMNAYPIVFAFGISSFEFAFSSSVETKCKQTGTMWKITPVMSVSENESFIVNLV